jgi:hypothetical protein
MPLAPHLPDVGLWLHILLVRPFPLKFLDIFSFIMYPIFLAEKKELFLLKLTSVPVVLFKVWQESK